MVNTTVLKVTGAVAVLAVSVTLIVFFVGNGSTGNSSTQTTSAPQWGGAGVGVHLLEWQWTDIAQECAQFLGPKGFKFVQVSPPQHHAYRADLTTTKPWWLRYQPINFGSLDSRSGNLSTFTSMLSSCYAAGVDIMVDAVINHQAGNTFGDCTAMRAWSFKNGGTGDSYTPCSPNPVYPGFVASDFHNWPNPKTPEPCESKTDDCKQFRIYDLSGLQDLNTDCGTIAFQYSNGQVVSCDSSYGMAAANCKSRQLVSKYLHSLLCLGVRSFRVDAAMSMTPNDLRTFLDNAVSWANVTNGCAQTANYFSYGPGNTFWGGNPNVWASSTKIDAGFFPFVYHEVYDGHSTYAPVHYQQNFVNQGKTYMAAVTDFDSAYNLWSSFKGSSVSYLIAWATAFSPAGGWNNYGNGAGATDSQHTVVFTDNHDIQRSTPNLVMTNWYGKDSTTGISKAYVNANSFILAYPFGTPVLMSSYDFVKAGTTMGLTDLGPPADAAGNTNDIYQNGVNVGCAPSSNPTSTSNQGISGGWICEHRWQGIANMVKWRNVIIGGSWQMRNAIVGGSSTTYGWPSALTGSEYGTCSTCGALVAGYPGMGFVRDGDGNYCFANARCKVGAVYVVNNHPSNWWYLPRWFVGIPDGYYCNIATNDWSNNTDYTDSYGNPVPVCVNNAGDRTANNALIKVTSGWITHQDGSTLRVPPMGFIAIHTGAVMPTGTGPAIYAPTIAYPASTLTFAVGAAGSVSPTVSPGLPPYKFSMTGTLPAGLTMSASTGLISGTPTAVDSQSITVTVTDSLLKTGEVTLTVTTTPPAAPDSVTCTPSQTYDAGLAVKVTCTVPLAAGSVTWSSADTVPSGLSWATVSNTYVLSGTTTNAAFALSTITVTATNAGGSTPGTFTIQVSPTNAAIAYSAPAFIFNQNTAISALTVPCGAICGPYSISPSLSTATGLTFSTSTGAISGTPSLSSASTVYTVSAAGGLSTQLTIKVNQVLLKTYSSCSWSGTFNSWSTTSSTAAMSLVASYNWQITGITLTAGTQYSFKFACNSQWFSSGLGYTPTNNVIASTTAIGTATTNMYFTPTKTGQYTANFFDNVRTFSIGPGANSAPQLTYTASSSNIVQLANTYTWTPTITQGNSPFTYAIVGGACPDGISFSTATGVFSGIPSTVGTSALQVNVTDTLGLTGSASLVIVVNAPAAPASVTCSPGGTSAVTYDAGVPISIVCTVPASTQGPITWTDNADYPAGTAFIVSSNTLSYTLTGTTTSILFSEATIQVTATNLGGSASGSFSLAVIPTDAAIVYTPSTQTYTQNVAISAWRSKCGAYCGSDAGYSVSPALPAGLSLDAGSGTISGTPTTEQLATTYTVSTASGLTATITITVAAAALNKNYAACVFAGTFDSWANPGSTNWCTSTVPGTLTLTANNVWTNPSVYLGATTYLFKIVCTSACQGGTQSWLSTGTTLSVSNNQATSTALSGVSGNMQATFTTTGNYRVTFNDNTKILSFALNNGPPNLNYGTNNNNILTAQTSATGILWSPSVQGGTPSYTYAIAGVLPSGLAFSTSTGIISGAVPATAQSTSVTITVTDSAGQQDTATVTVNVLAPQPPTEVTCAASQVAADANKAISVQCSVPSATAGIITYSAGTLPSGLSISSTTGLISGTTTNELFTNSVTISASNSGGSASTSLTFAIKPTTAAIAYPSQTVNVQVNTAMTTFSNPCAATCGTYTITPSLPSGLSISSSTGTVSGTPTVSAAATTYTIKATGASSNVIEFAFTLTVTSAPVPTTKAPTVAPTTGAPTTSDSRLAQVFGIPPWAGGTAYVWTGASTALLGAWPGTAMTAYTGSWYATPTFSIPASITSFNVLFASGSQKTGSAGTVCSFTPGATLIQCSISSCTTNGCTTVSLGAPDSPTTQAPTTDAPTTNAATTAGATTSDTRVAQVLGIPPWSNSKAYVWSGTATTYLGAWPGTTMTAYSGSWYATPTFTIPSSLTSFKVIFSSGSQQTGSSGTVCSFSAGSTAITCSISGCSTSGCTTVSVDSPTTAVPASTAAPTTATPTTEPATTLAVTTAAATTAAATTATATTAAATTATPTTSATTRTARVYGITPWNGGKAYVWSGTSTTYLGAWPGTAMTAYSGSWYATNTFTIPSTITSFKVIFNSGGQQTGSAGTVCSFTAGSTPINCAISGCSTSGCTTVSYTAP